MLKAFIRQWRWGWWWQPERNILSGPAGERHKSTASTASTVASTASTVLQPSVLSNAVKLSSSTASTASTAPVVLDSFDTMDRHLHLIWMVFGGLLTKDARKVSLDKCSHQGECTLAAVCLAQ